MTDHLPAGTLAALPADQPDPTWLVRLAVVRISRAHPAPALPGVEPRNADLVAQLALLLSAATGLAGAIADNAIDTGNLLPAAVVATLGASLQGVAHAMETASRFARSEALPALALPPGHRLPTAIDRHEWSSSAYLF